MIRTLLHLLRLCSFLRGGHRGGHRPLALENLALRQPLTVYQTAARPPLHRRDRLVWVWLSTMWIRILREGPDDTTRLGAVISRQTLPEKPNGLRRVP
jgi:hypothetical protein